MSVSSIASSAPPTPTNYLETGAQPAPAATTDADSSDAGAAQPVQAALPPGQGTRVDQIV